MIIYCAAEFPLWKKFKQQSVCSKHEIMYDKFQLEKPT